MERARRNAILPSILAMIAAMAAFQTGAALAKHLFEAVGPEGTATLRLGLGALMLLPVVRPWRARPRAVALLPLLGLGASMAGVILFFYKAMQHLPLGVTVALQFLGPLSVAIFGSRRPSDLVWAALAGLGVWSLTGTGIAAVPIDSQGLIWALGAAGCWAGYIVLGRHVSITLGQSTAALSVSIAALLILPVGVIHAGRSLVAPEILPLALLVAALSTSVPFSLEFYALSRLPARTFAIFGSLEPAFGVMSGFVLLHETLRHAQLAGIAMVMAATAGAAWFGTRTSTGEDEIAGTEAPPT